MRIKNRVDEAHWPLPCFYSLFVDKVDNSGENWRRSRGTPRESEIAIEDSGSVVSICGDVRKTPSVAVVDASAVLPITLYGYISS